jgi:hypothetical protein
MVKVFLSVAVFCALARGEDWKKPEQLVRALELKGSDIVLVVEPDAFLAPLIANRVRSVASLVVDFDDSKLVEHSADVIVLYDALHGVDHRSKFYPKLRRILRFGGRIVNIDLSTDPPSGPARPQLAAAQAVEEFTAAGFHVTRTINFLPYQYFQMFE